MKWGVWCEPISGMVMSKGRASSLRLGDAVAVYDKREDAEREAQLLNATIGRRAGGRPPDIRYSVRPMP